MKSAVNRARSEAFLISLVLAVPLALTAYSVMVSQLGALQDSLLRQNIDALGASMEASERSISTPLHESARTAIYRDQGLRPRSGDTGFQYWDHSNRLNVASSGFSNLPLDGSAPGFAEAEVSGHEWRILTSLDPSRHWIRVGQQTEGRRIVEQRLAEILLAAIFLVASIAAFVAERITRKSLEPVRMLAERIAQRAAGRMDPIGNDGLPDEFDPVVASINRLLPGTCR